MSWEDSYTPSQRTGGKSYHAPRLTEEEREAINEEIAAVKELNSREVRRIAQKFGVSSGLVRHYAKKANPDAFPRSNPTIPAKPKYKRVHFKPGQPVMNNEEMLQICSDYLRRFKLELDAGNIPCRNPNEAMNMMRLKKFLEGEADSRKEVKNAFSIEMLQELASNRSLEAPEDPALTGAIEVKPLRHEEEIPEELSGRRRIPERVEPPPPPAPARALELVEKPEDDEEEGERDWFGSV